MIASSSPSSKSSWPTWVLVLAAASAVGGCQWVFGDFEFRPDDGAGGAGTGGADGNGGAATGGANPNACSAGGDRRCDEGQPQVCTVDGWTNDGSPCFPADLCNNARGACDACLEGDKRCGTSYKTIETCNSSGESWDVTLTCSGTNFCDPNKLTSCVACSLGESHCTGGYKSVCKSDQSGFDSISCGQFACVTLSDTFAECGNCDPVTYPANCTTAGVLFECGINGMETETRCPNGCNSATSATKGYCSP